MAYKNLSGLIFNQLKVSHHAFYKNKKHYWLCHCECGKEKIVDGSSLKTGNTKSCGCYNSKIAKITAQRMRKGDDSIACFKDLYGAYKRQAKYRKLVWELSHDEVMVLFQDDCYYCGCEPKQIRKKSYRLGSFTYNGIDRKDNNIGYTLDNCVSCCKTCNFCKNTMHIDNFKQWIQLVYINLFNKDKQ